MENHEAMQQIAEESHEAIGLITKYLDHSARERESIENMMLEHVEQERDEWKERALTAERMLARARWNLDRMVFGDE